MNRPFLWIERALVMMKCIASSQKHHFPITTWHYYTDLTPFCQCLFQNFSVIFNILQFCAVCQVSFCIKNHFLCNFQATSVPAPSFLGAAIGKACRVAYLNRGQKDARRKSAGRFRTPSCRRGKSGAACPARPQRRWRDPRSRS